MQFAFSFGLSRRCCFFFFCFSSQLLVEHYSKTGLGVDILPHRLFSIGQQYHRRRDFMRGLVWDSLAPRPYVFHWSWTAGKGEKLKYSLETGTWYLGPQCGERSIRAHAGDPAFLGGCCLAPDEDQTGRKVAKPHPFLVLPNPLPEWATGA
mmetsp:Transcript_66857/g.151041  ORF Transcript_66857/g.151041 Transcript_66857/m.151041 type:complete len:151 (-) Transcript_66857:61-513(-)